MRPWLIWILHCVWPDLHFIRVPFFLGFSVITLHPFCHARFCEETNQHISSPNDHFFEKDCFGTARCGCKSHYQSFQQLSFKTDKHKVQKGRDMFLYSTVSSPLDRSKRFTLHPLADHSLHSHFHRCLHSGTHLYSWVNWGIVERTKMPKLWNCSKGRFVPGLYWLRVRHSTAELPRST